MKKLVALLVASLMSLTLTACELTEEASQSLGSNSDTPLSIVAATELEDLEPLVQQAAEELGFPINLEFHKGTLQNSQDLRDGKFDGSVDATWMATNRYCLLYTSDAADE